MLSAALDKGVNLFHTAIAYDGGNSFVEAAKVLPGRREEAFLAVKGLTSVDQFSQWLTCSRLTTPRSCSTRLTSRTRSTRMGRREVPGPQGRGPGALPGLTAHSNVGAVCGGCPVRSLGRDHAAVRAGSARGHARG